MCLHWLSARRCLTRPASAGTAYHDGPLSRCSPCAAMLLTARTVSVCLRTACAAMLPTAPTVLVRTVDAVQHAYRLARLALLQLLPDTEACGQHPTG